MTAMKAGNWTEMKGAVNAGVRVVVDCCLTIVGRFGSTCGGDHHEQAAIFVVVFVGNEERTDGNES